VNRAAGLLAALALAGCAGSSHRAETPKALTVPAYAGYPPITITVTEGTPELCRGDADAFARDAVAFLQPSTSPPDQFYLSARLQFFDFKAHLCDVAILREAVSHRLTEKQQRIIVERFGFLGETARELAPWSSFGS
jgi:hypothetical protein